MKKYLISLAALIAIAAIWIVSCTAGFGAGGFGNTGLGSGQGVASGPDNGSGQSSGQGYDANGQPGAQSPGPASASPEDQAREEAERQEQERLEREKQEQERLEQERLEAERSEKRKIILDKSELLFRGYFYEEALALLREDEDLINHETKNLEEEINRAADGLVKFDGEIKHIFFHSLILYPEYLFPNLNVPTGGYNEGFSFQAELVKMLPQLYERGYVLYDINAIFSKDENGDMRQNDIFLPPGKRPLVLSIDDPSYHYGIGFANRVILDEAGEIATEVITPDKETIITYDGDVELVVDNFVKEHPDFSYRGHKGLIAATGYMGIFGYDLLSEESRQDAKAVSDKMKENGWLFANHSYTHNRTGYWGPESNPNNISSDVRRWKERMEPVIGQTNVFIAPFGYTLRGAGMQVILDNGYDIYCNVDFNQKITVQPTHALMGRIEIGGYSLVRYTNMLNKDFFDVSSVIHHHRPPILSG